eukprot:4906364-Lingulodinium_polyedra.AAC.1
MLHAEPRLWRWFDDSESSGRQGPAPRLLWPAQAGPGACSEPGAHAGLLAVAQPAPRRCSPHCPGRQL